MIKYLSSAGICILIMHALNAQKTVPTLRANLPDTRFYDWGKPPVQDPYGPGNPWVHPHIMCHGAYESIKASSTLAPQGKFTYPITNLSDDNPKTAWVEGAADYGIGEYIEFSNYTFYGSELYILNGYQSSQTSWENNSRVKKLKVSCNGKDICILELGDVMGTQTFTLSDALLEKLNSDNVNEYKTIRFTIMEVYPGIKWKDTAITEIFTCGG
jgi:hypothetical protein